MRTLLPELGLTLLDGGHHHVARGSGGETVEAGTNTLDGNDVKVLGSSVISAVHHGADGQTEGNPELSTSGSTRTYKSTYDLVPPFISQGIARNQGYEPLLGMLYRRR